MILAMGSIIFVLSISTVDVAIRMAAIAQQSLSHLRPTFVSQ